MIPNIQIDITKIKEDKTIKKWKREKISGMENVFRQIDENGKNQRTT